MKNKTEIKPKLQVRTATTKDQQRIVDILNARIRERRYTALLTSVTVESRQDWFREHNNGTHQIYVIEDQDAVIGWMAVTAFRSGREAFDQTAEISYYVDTDREGRGIGKTLMAHVITECRQKGLKNLISMVFGDNERSLGLAKKFGFTEWGRLPQVIEIDGRVTDYLIMGLKI